MPRTRKQPFSIRFFMTSHICMCSLHTYCYILQAQISQKDHDYLKHLEYVFMYKHNIIEAIMLMSIVAF